MFHHPNVFVLALWHSTYCLHISRIKLCRKYKNILKKCSHADFDIMSIYRKNKNKIETKKRRNRNTNKNQYTIISKSVEGKSTRAVQFAVNSSI